MIECPRCWGHGKVSVKEACDGGPVGPFNEVEECPKCNGYGTVDEDLLPPSPRESLEECWRKESKAK